MNQKVIYSAKIQNCSLNSSVNTDDNQKSLDQSILNLDSFLRLNENDYWSDEIIDINHKFNDLQACELSEHSIIINNYKTLSNLYDNLLTKLSNYIDGYNILRNKYIDIKQENNNNILLIKTKDEQIKNNASYIIQLEYDLNNLLLMKDDNLHKEVSVNESLLNTDESERKIYDDIIKQISLEKSHLLEKINYASRIIKEKDDTIAMLRKELSQKETHLKKTINELNKSNSVNKKLTEKEIKRNSNSNLKQNENEDILYSNNIVLDYYANNNLDRNLINNFLKIKNSYIAKGKYKLSMEEENNKKLKTTSNRNTPTRLKKRISNKNGFFNNCQSKKIKNCNVKNSIQSSSNAIKNFLYLKNFNIQHCSSFTITASTSLLRRLAIYKRESQKTFVHKNESGYGLDYFLNNITDNENNFSDDETSKVLEIKLTNTTSEVKTSILVESIISFTINENCLSTKVEMPFSEAKSIYTKFFKKKNPYSCK